MKVFLCSIFTLLAFIGFAQKDGPHPAADSITISGLVNTPVTIALSALTGYADTTFSSIKIMNHLGEYKSTFQQVKAIPFNSFLKKQLAANLKGKDLLSLYFVCKAADGFTVVYSYNELFNLGPASIFILTAYDKTDLSNMPEKPILLITSDYKSGRLFMRGLRSIEVRSAK